MCLRLMVGVAIFSSCHRARVYIDDIWLADAVNPFVEGLGLSQHIVRRSASSAA